MEAFIHTQSIVSSSPDVLEGALVFAGTDAPVQTLIDYLEIGDTIDSFVAEFPAVTRSQVIAFLVSAKDLMAAASVAPHTPDPSMNGNGSHQNGASADEGAEFGRNAQNGALRPYGAWQSRAFPDPRTAPLSEIVKGLVEVITAEGPVLAYRAYTLYARGMGLLKIQEETKARFTRALRRAIDEQAVVVSEETTPDDYAYRFVRPTDSPQIVPRTRGERKIEEIPPLEIATLMRQILPDVAHIDEEGEEWLYRSVLDRYELIRITTHTKSVLDSALQFARDDTRWT